MSNKVSWFITGTSRGIGLQFVKQLTAEPENVVIASCRNPEDATDLQDLKNIAKGDLHIIKLEVTDEDAIKAAAEETSKIVGTNGLDYLLNNAAINPGMDSAFEFETSSLVNAFEHNVIAPAVLGKHFLPLLEKGNRKVIMNMTSGLGSIGLNLGPKCSSYSISKNAVNMLTYKQSAARPDIIAFVVDPGWVKTKMGGEGAFLDPHESVTPFIKLLKNATHKDSGKFFGHDGSEKPW
ncbi:NAD(P)-binding protein [Schizopora paradoxa]|uniref:NAD(P)-binding protein n=1 Tax=Schizopora paradoxa TaxID=27342 RepID=A0A0H2SC80_9AGAM|nr:NAD(P)-binding protein [Schizopora paradoxa]